MQEHPEVTMTATTQQLVQLMQLEERARTCTNRAEARLFIADAEAAKRKLWGNSAEAQRTHF
ncbi:hypothetical protein SynRS9909_01317 [Synechococcus sp. RS9909]|nr:hypothetical protein RS9917_13375 [Synechococcus sp. RS9917]QNI79304.1 hypothetical protein SynRS9909_01317 [Synechococcus sp. RS9909]